MRVGLGAGDRRSSVSGFGPGKALRARGHAVHFVVKKDATTQSQLAREGFASSALFFEGFPRGLSLAALTFPVVAAAAYCSAARVDVGSDPTSSGMGGYVSVPLGLWAGLHRVPLVLHEQNVRAGLANRFLSRWASAIGVTFEETVGLPANRCVTTGLPLRPDLVPGDPGRPGGPWARRNVLDVFGLRRQSGARALNRRWIESLPRLRRTGETWQFIHLTGTADESSVQAAYAADGRAAYVRGFQADMAPVYSAADVVVGRAGANTVMEIRRMGKTALLVPFPHATNDHQRANAQALARAGGATVIDERDLSVERLVGALTGLPPAEALRRDNERRRAEVPTDFLRAADRLADLVEAAGRKGAS